MDYDLLIKNGDIVDGSGKPRFTGDVGIKSGRIATVGKAEGRAKHTIDAKGLVVSPGFLDIHTHYDAQLTWDPLATSSCWQGVTTVLTGNCSFSIAPCRLSDRDFLMQFFSKVEGVPAETLRAGPAWTWETFPEYIRAIDKPLGLNAIVMVGHSALRYYHVGREASQRPSTPAEVEAMRHALGEAMAAGAFGFTTDYYFEVTHTGEPIPSRLASQDELFGLAEVVRDARAGFIEILPESFMWGPVAKDRAMLTRLALHCRRPVLWNQFAHTWEAPEIWREVIAYHKEAAAQGAKVYGINQCLRFDLRMQLQDPGPRLFAKKGAWRELLSRPIEERHHLAKDEGFRQRLRTDLLTKDPESTFIHLMQIVYFNQVKAPQNHKYLGRSLAELGRLHNRHPADILLEVAEADGYETEIEFRGVFGGDETAQAEIIRDPYSIAGESDGGAHCTAHVGTGFGTHLLSFWVRKKGIMSLEEGVRRLTSMPASAIGLHDRGFVKEGLAADLVVFDPETLEPGEKVAVSDFPGGVSRLVQRARGIKATIVNGEALGMDGEHTGALPGRVLKSGWYRK